MNFSNKKILLKAIFISSAIGLVTTSAFSEKVDIQVKPVEQKSIGRVDQMSQIPKDLQIINFKSLAQNFDKEVFNWNVKAEHWPVIWMDKTQKNFPQNTFGIYTAMGDARQGPDNTDGKVHEAVAGMGAVLGSTLVGVDKSNQDTYNYVTMLKNYYGEDGGWNIMQNNVDDESGATGGGYHRDWWYDIFPNVMFYAIADKYPNQRDFTKLQKAIADKFYAANNILKGDYGYSFFNYAQMLPQHSDVPAQYDAAAGHSWVLYDAYKKFGDKKYLQGSIDSLQALEDVKEDPTQNTPFYEVLMPFGAYMAAKLNAEQNTHFDVQKMLDWSFNGKGGPRPDWGVIVGEWNGYDVSGMVGSTSDRGGYGFLMNTYDMAWPLVPMVRYDQEYANAVGKWMLHAANVARYFYPQYMNQNHQALKKGYAENTGKSVIAYEGLIHDFHPVTDYAGPDADKFNNDVDNIKAPIAQGDGPGWIRDEEGKAINPVSTELGVYGSAHVGIFGAIIEKTNVDNILQFNLLATDFYHDPAYPSYLYYNPNTQAKTVSVNLANLTKAKKVSIYDTVNAKWLKKDVVARKIDISISGESSKVLVIVPANAKIVAKAGKLYANGRVIDYNYQGDK
ncbi:hypothetical protein LO80_04690 [Candidatus Francisella endociliophora]|uniref:Uncharacterized protein n=1 Tax=Candidatus Francisella endociliophora TaxID=653937 RepID=A0A097EP47_9GAMM|nr:hypothetical protein [Francisella sp. FSC1006]AIT09334.1 hypothetical protein LO80_04690 [Francisella sp. FSC1006]